MNLKHLLSRNVLFAWEMMLAHKLRSVLSMLGIVFGVASLFVTLAIAQGTQDHIMRIIQSMGTNLMYVSLKVNPDFMALGGWDPLKNEYGEVLRQQIPKIKKVSGALNSSIQLELQGHVSFHSLYGVGEEYLDIRDLKVIQGRTFHPNDHEAKARVCIIGQDVAEVLKQKGLPSKLHFLGQSWDVIGMVESKKTFMGDGFLDIVMVPLEALQEVMQKTDEISNIFIEFKEELNPSLRLQVRNVLKAIRGGNETIEVWDQKLLLESKEKIARSLKWTLASLAGISLFIGGIGIMNILLASVAERVREIGLRRALGASHQDIFLQFIGESVILSLLGAFLGLTLGIAVSGYVEQLLAELLGALGAWEAVIDLWNIIYTVFFAFIIGVVFGVFPARKAISLDPCESLNFYV